MQIPGGAREGMVMDEIDTCITNSKMMSYNYQDITEKTVRLDAKWYVF